MFHEEHCFPLPISHTTQVSDERLDPEGQSTAGKVLLRRQAIAADKDEGATVTAGCGEMMMMMGAVIVSQQTVVLTRGRLVTAAASYKHGHHGLSCYVH